MIGRQLSLGLGVERAAECGRIGCSPPSRSMTDSLRWPMAAWTEHHTPPASGPRFTIVAVIASITGRSDLRSRLKENIQPFW